MSKEDKDATIARLLERLETVTKRLEQMESKGSGGGGGGGGGGGAAGESSESVVAFDELAKRLGKYYEVSKALGADIAAHAELVSQAQAALRAVLVAGASCKKPSEADLPVVLKSLSEKMGEVVSFRESKRGHQQFDHLSTVSEGISAFGWVSVSPTPGPFVHQAAGGAEFYSNKLLKLYRGKDEAQTNWVMSFTGFLKEMETYIKDHHRTGLTWAGSEDAKAFIASYGGGGARRNTETQALSKPAINPPSKSAPAPAASSAPPAASGAGLFSELNKGANITSGLKKVAKEDMTHKNPALRAGGVVKEVEKKEPAGRKGLPSGSPTFGLQGSKWVCEYQDQKKDFVIDKPDIKHSVYIYGCWDCVIQVKGKVNQISMDSCKKVSVVCTDVVSSVAVVNTNGCQVQVMGKCPNLSLEKVSGAQLFLSKDCLEAEVITAKTDSCVISVPHGDDLVEIPIPEQFKSTVNMQGKKPTLDTKQVDHSGG